MTILWVLGVLSVLAVGFWLGDLLAELFTVAMIASVVLEILR